MLDSHMTQRILSLIFEHVSNWKRQAFHEMFPIIGNPFPFHLEMFLIHLEAFPIHLEMSPIHLEKLLPLVFFMDCIRNSIWMNHSDELASPTTTDIDLPFQTVHTFHLKVLKTFLLHSFFASSSFRDHRLTSTSSFRLKLSLP